MLAALLLEDKSNVNEDSSPKAKLSHMLSLVSTATSFASKIQKAQG
jgi:hypothetical protein